MSIAIFLKNNLKNIPPSLGKWINTIPYSKRPGIGEIYSKRQLDIVDVNNYTITEKQNFVLKRLKILVDFAYDNIKFYKEYYDQQGFHPSELINFNDLHKIPIITKSVLNNYNIEERSFKKKGRYIVNTGGSAGTPFGFYIEPDSMGHEWAHMHSIWEKIGYNCADLKIVFGGRSDVKNCVEYDVVRNHFAIDIYASYDVVCNKLKNIVKKHKIKYLHGYPSSIYDFAVYCEINEPKLVELLKKNLKGAFLGSEYPHKHYRDKIEEVFSIKTISWYGHTERAVLAYEKNNAFEFEPFLSYGFAEAIKDEKDDFNLIATSYYNFASPLIRYNTEDIVEQPLLSEGILKSFKVLNGRSGEFIIDKEGKNINLTGLIFGRHHELFNYSKFIQIKQLSNGKIEIYFVSNNLSEKDASKLFDNKNLNFDISFKKIDEPIRTISGKINLLVK